MKTRGKPKFIEHNSTMSDGVCDAYAQFQELGEEMRSWADNMEEKFSQTEKYSRVSECADLLESIQEADVPDAFSDWAISYTSSTKRKMSRSDRRDDACAILYAIVQALEDIVGDEEKNSEKLRSTAEDFRDNVQQMIDEAESAEFTGMFG